MPGIRDKILINGRTTVGTHKAIVQEYENLKGLSGEVDKHGWLGEFQDLRDEMQEACAAHDAADLEYLHKLRKIRDKISDRLDQKLGLTP